MGFKRIANARWEGDLIAGKGGMSTPQSGLFADQNYSFKTRFCYEQGTNPEELLAAAHAGFFIMALSAVLGKAGFTPDRIDTRAEAMMEPGMDPGPTVTSMGHVSPWRRIAKTRLSLTFFPAPLVPEP